MSTPTLELTVPVADAVERLRLEQQRRGRGVRLVAAVLAAPAATALAWLVHELAPNGQPIAPTGLYARCLQGFLVLTLLLALAQALWPRLRPWVRWNGPLLAGAVCLVMAWDVVTLKLSLLQLPYFPGPDMVLHALVEDRKMLFDSTYYSLRLLATGYMAGLCAGLITGVLMGWFRNVHYWGMPLFKVLGPIPATALVPLVIVVFNDSYYSGAALIAWAVWFPVTMLTSSGIANVPAAYFDVARTLGAGRLYLILRVAVPAALPNIFLGTFVGLLTSFLTLIVAETTGVRNGLGWYLEWQKSYMEYAKVGAVLVIMAFFFSGIMSLLFRVRNRVLRWQKGMIRW